MRSSVLTAIYKCLHLTCNKCNFHWKMSWDMYVFSFSVDVILCYVCSCCSGRLCVCVRRYAVVAVSIFIQKVTGGKSGIDAQHFFRLCFVASVNIICYSSTSKVLHMEEFCVRIQSIICHSIPFHICSCTHTYTHTYASTFTHTGREWKLFDYISPLTLANEFFRLLISFRLCWALLAAPTVSSLHIWSLESVLRKLKLFCASLMVRTGYSVTTSSNKQNETTSPFRGCCRTSYVEHTWPISRRVLIWFRSHVQLLAEKSNSKLLRMFLKMQIPSARTLGPFCCL